MKDSQREVAESLNSAYEKTSSQKQVLLEKPTSMMQITEIAEMIEERSDTGSPHTNSI